MSRTIARASGALSGGLIASTVAVVMAGRGIADRQLSSARSGQSRCRSCSQKPGRQRKQTSAEGPFADHYQSLFSLAECLSGFVLAAANLGPSSASNVGVLIPCARAAAQIGWALRLTSGGRLARSCCRGHELKHWRRPRTSLGERRTCLLARSRGRDLSAIAKAQSGGFILRTRGRGRVATSIRSVAVVSATR